MGSRNLSGIGHRKGWKQFLDPPQKSGTVPAPFEMACPEIPFPASDLFQSVVPVEFQVIQDHFSALSGCFSRNEHQRYEYK